ncbi:hypothetical protein TELCIR_26177 [Teladorsagia circumcincta]|uniref:Oxidoreductase FAD/NAD(P)-binding domain-containing protein n=1 Tax=Teladorsagia circumcincta TaxID=45464 RepID=A0A2G9T3J5_TELCI|nr:hypothetical protein TELCIR_26177 [Teladorsagia circumcincta]
MLAAGTGLTPMVNVLRARLKKIVNEDMLKSNTRLLLFNKTENDIVSDDWLPMKWSDERITARWIKDKDKNVTLLRWNIFSVIHLKNGKGVREE